ncbi:Uma2 family endonuclease [Tundrisphaera lichenicola]|uniref:Uma2 family endonuclease n=1 Tax=Tundrisphaera lichenicola TaxID=2029860 RepID=UPI003EBC79E4
MTQATLSPPGFRNVAELLHQLGDIPADRVRLVPSPGHATEQDLLKPDARLCELIEGVLVEKAMGALESMLAVELILSLAAFVKQHRLGIILGADGMLRLMPGRVRIPDISFLSWDRLGGKPPSDPIPALAPDLTVEILSPSNTEAEMTRKLREYFESGVRLAWLIDPRTRSARIYTSPVSMATLDEGQDLEGGEVLPGFALPLRDLFECLDRGRDG